MTPKRSIVALCCAIALLGALAAPAAASSWTLRQLPPTTFGESQAFAPGLFGISCPTESLCVAAGSQNTLIVSQAPTGGIGQWRVVNPLPPIGPGKTCVKGEPDCYPPKSALRSVSCPSPELCVLVSYDGFVYVSPDPTAGAAAWSSFLLPERQANMHPTSVSCPTESLCVAVTGGYRAAGRVLTSTDPLSGTWQVTPLGSPLDLRGVSCGTPAFCVAVAAEGQIFVSTEPTGGASAWRLVGTPGGGGDLEGLDCVASLLCVAGNLTGNVLTSTDPGGASASWHEANAGSSVQLTDVSCPTADRCVAVDSNGSVLTSADPTGGSGSWHFENLIPFSPTEEREGQPPRNALFGVSCASTSLCALVGQDGHIFTSTDPFSPPAAAPTRKSRPRPRTILLFAEHFWRHSSTRRFRIRARFRFYSPTRAKGFECKRDRGPYRRCRSPLRYLVTHGRHALRVRAIGPSGLRGPAAVKRFIVLKPGQQPHHPPEAVASGG
ncbi:MAG TPA: hypothetical protein VFJ57_00220 [Solirubrobacterales bacterium]|nr:hypothetical protein [Solirubrobacterales bacterium]